MPDAKVSDKDYIDHLIASPLYISATEAAKVAPITSDPPAHDAFTRLLHRLEPDAETLWTEAQTQLVLTEGVLVLDTRQTLRSGYGAGDATLVGQA